jgi:RNA polymerase sigma factor (sigma-70 family)
MGRLPEQQRIVFELRFYKQYQFEEIAEITGKALGTVKTLYREAVKKLRVEATEKGWRS